MLLSVILIDDDRNLSFIESKILPYIINILLYFVRVENVSYTHVYIYIYIIQKLWGF